MSYLDKIIVKKKIDRLKEESPKAEENRKPASDKLYRDMTKEERKEIHKKEDENAAKRKKIRQDAGLKE